MSSPEYVVMPIDQLAGSNANRSHWEQLSPINEQLRGIVEPLAEAFAGDMAKHLANTTPESRAAMLGVSGNIYTLPYGRMGVLPPAVFGNIATDHMERTERLVVPRRDSAIAARAERYYEWAFKTAVGNYEIFSFPRPSAIAAEMMQLKGRRYPEAAWQRSASQLQLALRQETSFTIESHRGNRIINAASDYEEQNDDTKATHRPYRAYSLGITSTYTAEGDHVSTRDSVQLPIGEYGKAATDKLVHVTLALNNHAKFSSELSNTTDRLVTPKTTDTVKTFVARVRDRLGDRENRAAQIGLVDNLTEGIVSMSQVLAMLTSEKVPGYDDHNKLIVALLDSDIIEKFTRSVWAGYIGPTTLAGFHVRQPLEVSKGKLVLSGNTIDILSQNRRKYRSEMLAEWAIHNHPDTKTKIPTTLGLICPASAPNGAITMLKPAFRAFYAA